MFFWGSANYHKMGFDRNVTTVDQPLHAEWYIEKTGFYTETGAGAMRHQLRFIEPMKRKDVPKNAEILTQMKEVTWGDTHCTMLDTKGRLFSCGASQKGRLGLADKDIPGMMKYPTQITIGLPTPSNQSKIIHVTSGVSHTLAVTKSGDMYTWGEGAL